MTWPCIWDPKWAIAADYVDEALPGLYLLDARGVIRLRASGMPRDPEQLDELIEQLLDEVR